MVTLTFDRKRYRSDDYDVSLLSGFLAELRRKLPEFGYLFIPELHADMCHFTGYITKYITKSNSAMLPNKKRYYASRNVRRVEPEFEGREDRQQGKS